MTRVAFVGQRQYFEDCSMPAPAGGVEPRFFDHRGGVDAEPVLAEIAEFAPDVIVVFRPEILPPGVLREFDAVTLGYNTEPLPRTVDGSPHADLQFRLDELRGADYSQYDRLITFDPFSASAAISAGVPIWRSLPLPVTDLLYRPVQAVPGGRAAFFGASSEHRERWLTPVKHETDLLHVVHGALGDQIIDYYDQTLVAVNLHFEAFPSFENRVPKHLAFGHLVVSETLDPRLGLEPGIDYLEVLTPGALRTAVAGALRRPEAYRSMRIRGRRKAEIFRASRVWPRVVSDLVCAVSA